jgi:hypothetical protein
MVLSSHRDNPTSRPTIKIVIVRNVSMLGWHISNHGNCRDTTGTSENSGSVTHTSLLEILPCACSTWTARNTKVRTNLLKVLKRKLHVRWLMANRNKQVMYNRMIWYNIMNSSKKTIESFLNCKRKLLHCNVNINFNTTCLKIKIVPKYVHIKTDT